MRHRVAHRKLGRTTEHRRALLRNQAEALIRHERISTTVAKAKELRPFVERLITVAKRGIAEGAESGRALHARRLVARDVTDRAVARKLFEAIAPRFATRPGGYTRLLRAGRRQGDDAELAQVELLGSEYAETEAAASTEQDATAEAKGVGGRIRRAARRIRGGKAAQLETPAADAEPPTKTASGAKKKTAKTAKRAASAKRTRKKRTADD